MKTLTHRVITGIECFFFKSSFIHCHEWWPRTSHGIIEGIVCPAVANQFNVCSSGLWGLNKTTSWLWARIVCIFFLLLQTLSVRTGVGTCVGKVMPSRATRYHHHFNVHFFFWASTNWRDFYNTTQTDTLPASNLTLSTKVFFIICPRG